MSPKGGATWGNSIPLADHGTLSVPWSAILRPNVRCNMKKKSSKTLKIRDVKSESDSGIFWTGGEACKALNSNWRRHDVIGSSTCESGRSVESAFWRHHPSSPPGRAGGGQSGLSRQTDCKVAVKTLIPSGMLRRSGKKEG